MSENRTLLRKYSLFLIIYMTQMTYYFFDWGIHLELWKAKYQISSEPNIGVVLGFSNFDVHTSSLPCRLYFFRWLNMKSPCIFSFYNATLTFFHRDMRSISLLLSLGGTTTIVEAIFKRNISFWNLANRLRRDLTTRSFLKRLKIISFS